MKPILNRLPALLIVAAVPLAGCTDPFLVAGDPPTCNPCGPISLPIGTPPIGNVAAPVTPPQPAGGGIGLADAFHDAEHYFAGQNETAQLVDASSEAVDANGISGADGWTFTFVVDRPEPPVYRMPAQPIAIPLGNAMMPIPAPTPSVDPVPSPAPGVQPSPIPVDPPIFAPRQEISLQVDGSGNVMAPRNLTQSGDPTLSFRQTVSLTSILATVADIGSPASPAGYSVKLRTDAQLGPVFEVGPDVSYRNFPPAVDPIAPTPDPSSTAPAGPCYCDYPVGAPAPVYTQSIVHPTANYGGGVAAYRGTYVLDAYSGEILARPNGL